MKSLIEEKRKDKEIEDQEDSTIEMIEEKRRREQNLKIDSKIVLEGITNRIEDILYWSRVL